MVPYGAGRAASGTTHRSARTLARISPLIASDLLRFMASPASCVVSEPWAVARIWERSVTTIRDNSITQKGEFRNALIRDAMGYPPARLWRSDRMKTKHVRPAAAVVGTLLAGALYATPATAGQFNARISGILLYEDGNLVYVYPQGGVQSPPACHGST